MFAIFKNLRDLCILRKEVNNIMYHMKRKLFTAVATLSGTVIGAGFLGIPFVVSRSGYLIGLGWMAFISIMMIFVSLMMGEIVLSSKSLHHIAGYSSKYLGKKTKLLVLIASIVGFYSALVAYLIGEGESLSFLFFGNSNYVIWFGLGFWFIMAILTFGGIKEFRKVEPITVGLVLLVVLVLGIINFGNIDLTNLNTFNTAQFFTPFGVVLFAFLGISAIPEMKRVLGKNQSLMKKSIIIGNLIPLFVYIVFTTIVLGLYGTNVTEVATIGFGKIVTMLGVVTMFGAFLALSLALQDTYRFDLYLHKKIAWLLGVVIPLVLFVLIKVFDFAGFTKVLSFGGAISGGFLSIIILLVHEHLKDFDGRKHREPEFKIKLPLMIKILFIIVFIVGMIYEVL